MTVLRFNSLAHAEAFAANLIGKDRLTFYAEIQVCIAIQDDSVANDGIIVAGLIEQVTIPDSTERVVRALGNPEDWDNFFARAANAATGEVRISHVC